MVPRLFSVDVVMVLLEQTERSPEECQDPELTCFLPHKFLIQSVLFARRTDESPTVQGHALACLAQCLELPSLNVTRAVHNLFSASEKTHKQTHTHYLTGRNTWIWKWLIFLWSLCRCDKCGVNLDRFSKQHSLWNWGMYTHEGGKSPKPLGYIYIFSTAMFTS